MDSSYVGWLIFFIGVFIVLNAFFSLIETAMTESHKSRLEKMADDDLSGAKEALALLEHPEDVLAVTQAGITLMGVLSGLGGGVLALSSLGVFFRTLPQAEVLSVALIAVLITGSMLLLGEFLPKKIARQDPEGILLKHHAKLQRFTALARPFLDFLSKTADTILIIFGLNPHIEDTVTEDEVKDLIEQGTEDGTFEKTEQTMVDRIFRLSDQTAYALMTPRTRMLWLDLSDGERHNLRVIRANPSKVFAVGEGSLDEFRGVLHTKDLLNASLDHQPLDLRKLIRKPLFVPRSLETFRLLDRFRSDNIHEAIVQDEYGGVVGFITLDDIVAAVLGDSTRGEGAEAGQIVSRDESSWIVAGLCSIDEFKDRFDLTELPDESRWSYQTMGGFLTSYFGYIPQKGERAEYGGLTFEIMAMDRARIDKILVTKK